MAGRLNRVLAGLGGVVLTGPAAPALAPGATA